LLAKAGDELKVEARNMPSGLLRKQSPYFS